MLPPWPSILTALSEITRKNYTTLIRCPHCGNKFCFVRYGFYSRYLFDDELVQIQRYRCDNDQCPQKTFSILPHAFLRIARIPLCLFMLVLRLDEQGYSIAAIARYTGSNWPRIQRWIAKAEKIKKWIDTEQKHSHPCLLPKDQWSLFIRDFSWAIYPRRYGVPAINTKRISL
jgi:transposase-like protein